MEGQEQEARLRRIARMEDIYDRGVEAVEALLRAAEQYTALKPELEALESYYLGKLWMEDFFADRAGEIPRDMKRGILTEDAIYDLLTDRARLKTALQELVQE